MPRNAHNDALLAITIRNRASLVRQDRAGAF
jgi:hypothetical protein